MEDTGSDDVEFEDDTADDEESDTIVLDDDGDDTRPALAGGPAWLGGTAVDAAEPKVLAVCLTPEKQRARQQELIDQVTEVLAVSQGAAFILLRAFKWTVSGLQERYFDDSSKIAAQTGVDSTPRSPGDVPYVSMVNTSNAEECGVCFSADETTTLVAVKACRHFFCADCYAQYVAVAISSNGIRSLDTTCAARGCPFVLERSMVLHLLSHSTLEGSVKGKNRTLAGLYETFAGRSFVEDNACMKWCPSSKCDNAIFLQGHVEAPEALPVTCGCGYCFCFNCSHENHSPATCKMLKVWMQKEREDSATDTWIVANTKPCPGCGANIEKNAGCNHISCRSCGFNFCWVCELPWSKHGTSFYACNFYDPASDVDKGARDAADEEHRKYLFYHLRYQNHDKSKSLEALTQQTRLKVNRMAAVSSTPPPDHGEHLHDAVQHLLHSRETLKFSYVYAYF
eukprot:gene21479-33043_t